MEELYQVEANIDDMNPQVLEYAFTRLLDLGVRDVWAIPMMMKRTVWQRWSVSSVPKRTWSPSVPSYLKKRRLSASAIFRYSGLFVIGP